jgi:anti-anti-sigma factor
MADRACEKGEGLEKAAGLFDVKRQGDMFVITPCANLGELAFQQIEASATEILGLLQQSAAPRVVVDFGNTQYFGTTALAFFLKLWKRVRTHGGNLAFCNVSDLEKEILKLTRLDRLWIICGSKDEAIGALAP